MPSSRTTETQGSHDLYDAFRKQGCPVCILTESAVHRYMTSTNYDSVGDPVVRGLFERSHGFCNLHAHSWLEEAFVLGTAQIYRDVLRVSFDDLRRQSFRSRPLSQRMSGMLGWGRAENGAGLAQPTGPCPACDIMVETETRLRRTLLRGLADAEYREAYAASDGLCLGHLRPALLEAERPEVFDALQQRAIATREILLAHLDETIRKHDYRFRDEPTGDEKGSPARAVEHVAGRRGVTRRQPR
ncbi:MAG TPA: DUF6062 family protein [Thermomicrobiales bacterium]|nr:DUF6062 family protein [Thermomicrobiales bacterium]